MSGFRQWVDGDRGFPLDTSLEEHRKKPARIKKHVDDRKRLDILPGITCIWQISGRSDIPFREQVVLDKEYIRGQGFWKDVLILFKTVPAVLTGKGAY